MNAYATGSQIRWLRLAHGWSLGELARRAGTSAPTVHRYENGWARFEIATLAKLAAALGCQLHVSLQPETSDAERPTATQLARRLQRLFWDRRLRASDLGRYRAWVVQRVIEYGNLEDLAALVRYYGKETFLDVVAGLHIGSRKTRVFWEAMLREEGRPCTRRFSRAEVASFWTA